MKFLRDYCAFIGGMTNGQWHRLLAERGTLRTTIGDCDDHDVERGELGYCYMNAALEALDREDVTYVQGVAVAGEVPIPVEHAWLELDDGTVLDNTWEQGHGIGYLGVAIDRETLRACLLRGEVYGHVDIELIEALTEAHEQVGTIDGQRGQFEALARINEELAA